ncbi:metallothionein-like protein type 2 [Artemisia annua]|uniref:Metallothionein-like protein n=1 Tax=Artemisia annua TaxID=35608 RepID=A0A2U1QN09_ARTAN|nr:metallothionein-like protein type 2 [Artemisia annua]
MSSSCCAGKCGCGSGCKCGSSCSGCKMYPDTSSFETATNSETLILGVAPKKTELETGGAGAAAENGGCKCNPCNCHPCTCK